MAAAHPHSALILHAAHICPPALSTASTRSPLRRPSQAYDINGDGVISLDELERSAHEQELLQTKFHLYQFFTFALALFLLLSLACNFGVVYGVVQYSRQTSGALHPAPPVTERMIDGC